MSGESTRAAFDAQVNEFGAVMTATYADRLLSLGPTRSVATGAPLADSALRFSVAVRLDETAFFWGLAQLNEPEVFEFPCHGFGIEAGALPDILRGLREPLDWALLKRSLGGPVFRRTTISEHAKYPLLTDESAVLLLGSKRMLLASFPWLPEDPFYLTGEPAEHAAKIALAAQEGRATVGTVFGNPIVFMHDHNVNPPFKLKSLLVNSGSPR